MEINELYKLIALDDMSNGNGLEKVKYVDDEGYLYSLSKKNINTLKLRNSIPAKFFNCNPYSLENIENYIKINKIPITLSYNNNIKSAKDKISFNCETHGEFIKSWNEIKNGQYCPRCGRNKANEIKKNAYEDIKKAFNNAGYILISKEYINNETLLEYICPVHKNEGIKRITWGNFIMGKRCSSCSKEKTHDKQRKTQEEFISELNQLYGDKFKVLERYISTNTKIKLHCNDCNTDFKQKPGHLLNGHIGCNCKEKSLGEKLVKECLQKYNISFEQEYRFPDCKNKKPLPFDFAIFDNEHNLINLIEFQGKQHYENTHWSSDIKKSERSFEQRKINDRIKKEYCDCKSINLIEIPYWKISNIEEILINR